MEMFQIMGTIALNGASGVISDLNSVSSSASDTASAMESASGGVESANSGMSNSFSGLISSVQNYKAEGMTTSQAWQQATADMQASTDTASNGMVNAFARIGTAVATYLAVDKIIEFGQSCVEAWQVQETAELKLETVMKQRMGATDSSVQSIKNLTSAQQELGAVGDEVQMSGAQQLATFLNTDSALATLIPAMNDLAVQQNGYNVTSEQMVSIGNMFGKVMQGQTSALTRCGITFSEAQEEILKYGTEEEKASVLAQVITENVGNMNEILAQTDSGRIQQAKNRMGDLKEEVGHALMPVIAGFYEIMEKVYTFMMNNLITAIQNVTQFAQEHKPLIEGIGIALGVLTTAIIAYNIAQNASAIATAISTTALTAFGTVMAFITSPVTLVVLAIGAVVAGFVLLYQKCEPVRNAVNNVANTIKNYLLNAFESIKPYVDGVISAFMEFASAVKDFVVNACQWVVNAIQTMQTSSNPILVAFRNLFQTTWEIIQTITQTVFNNIQVVIQTVLSVIQNIFKLFTSVLKGDWQGAWGAIKNIVTTVLNGIKSVVSNITNAISSTVSSVWNGIKSTTISVWNSIKDSIISPITSAKETVFGIIDTIRSKASSIFNGIVPKLHLSLPHVSVSGGKAPWGIAGRGSLPSFHVSWNRKAMDNPYLFQDPTLFNLNPMTGTASGAGEAGDEVMYGRENLMRDIGLSVADKNLSLEKKLDRIVDLLVQFFPEALANMQQPVVLDTGVLVSSTAPAMNRELGRISVQKGRGR